MKTVKALSFILIALIVLGLIPQPALAADLSASTPEELTAALGAAADGDTIWLTADINYTSGISISGKTITFDLNGHTLNVANSTGDGLFVGSGGVVNLTGSGAFNVASSAANSYGVNTGSGGRATVTNAASTGSAGVGAHAIGSGSYVHVMGNATSTDNIGALARNYGTVIVDGNAEGGITGADAVGTDSLIEVAGNVAGGVGVSCALGATVRVGGNVNATGYDPTPYAIAISFGGSVTVGGNVKASGTANVGAWIYDGGTITIDGTLVAPVHVKLQDIAKTIAEGVPGTAPYEDYLIYTDGSNTVRVKHHPEISPASVAFDKNNQADVGVAIAWNIAASVTDVKAGGTSIGAENYSVSKDTLTIKKEFLAAQALGVLDLVIEFNEGQPTPLTISISDTTPITGLPGNHTLYVGGRVTWNPAPTGGTWYWDEEYLSAVFNNTTTFTALKPGTTTVTYSINGISHSITITIRQSELPQTGQDSTVLWVLVSLAVLTGIVAVTVAIKAKMKRNEVRS